MGEILYRSVGLGGKNLRDDTVKVQKRLVARGYTLGKIDGLCGRRTIAAIVSFQSSFLRKPDGLISPDGPTWRRLEGAATAAPKPSPVPAPPPKPPVPQAKRSDEFTKFLTAPPKNTINVGVSPLSNKFMHMKLGAPRQSYSANCQEVTNPGIRAKLVTESVGPFRVTGLKPVVDSLKLVMGDVREKLPDLYSVLGTAGMLCCRFVRGSTTAISNHSWGTAVDVTLSGKLDIRGDGKVQMGLTLLAPIFNARGWYWGAGFPTEDGMHFEPGTALFNQLLP